MPHPLLAVPGRRRWLAGAFVLALLAGCGRNELDGTVTEPAGAVVHLARQLADGDLEGFARDAVPPDRHAALSQAWEEGDSLWPLTGLPLDEHLPGLLESLAAPKAEATLGRAFDAQLAGQATAVRQAAQSLGLFGEQYIAHHGQYSDEQRQHYRQLVKALSQWAGSAPLAEREPARQAIGQLTRVVRDSGIDGAAALQAAGMTGALRALAPVQQQAMQVLAGYGLDVRGALEGLQAGLVSEDGDQARVRVHYPLAGQAIQFEAEMVRIGGRWYMAQTLDDVQATLEHARRARRDRQQESAGATELAAGEAAGRPQTNQQMAPAP